MDSSVGESYFDLLIRSRLLLPAQLEKVLFDLKNELQVDSVTDDQLSSRLLQSGQITTWQDRKLRQGMDQWFFLGKYKLLRPLGSGGMAKVYLGSHVQMQRKVALKILPPALVENSSYLARFYQESRATAALDHPNIVRAYDIDNEGAVHYLVMEYVEGRDLQNTVEKLGPLPPEKVADYIRQTAEGLAHAHQRGFVHRDIKPGNLLLDTTATVKILDMGVARIAGQSDAESLTLAHNDDVLGTVDYLSPEQVLDSHNVDARADLYSLGCTMYFLMTGQAPFPEGTMAVRLMKHQMEEPKPVSQIRPDMPASLIAICSKMMAKRPEKRQDSAQIVAAELRKWMESSQGGTPAVAESVTMSGPASGGMPNLTGGLEGMLQRLMSERTLTPYQISILTGSSTDPLGLDGYQIIERFTSGRLANFYRARHSELQFPAIVKLIYPEQSREDWQQRLARFQHEARIASQVHHPHVVRTYQVGQSGKYYFLSFETLSGQTLSDLLAKEGALSTAEACRLTRDAALGLAHLHEQEIVHRAVCPANMLLNENRLVKLFDLSQARDSLGHLDPPSLESRPNEESFFTPAYVSPEQALDPQAASVASDMYSLGCVLYHTLTGHVPFPAANAQQQMQMHINSTVTPPSKINPKVPTILDQVVLRLLAKLPAARPKNAARLAEVLDSIV